MIRLGRADLEAILCFLADAGEIEFEVPYPAEFVALLQRLIPCEAIAYQEADLSARSFYGEPEADDEVYWSLGPCPIVDYRARSGDLSALRMSDVIPRRRFNELPIYREYFRPAGIDHMLDVALSVARTRYRTFIFFRGRSDRDFSERDRAVLELLRPHLQHLESQAALRRALSSALREHDNGRSLYASLTPREREIVELVGRGKTNAEIAAALWVAPSTVKKHLENVYAKTGIGRRAAVVAAQYAPPA